MTVPAGERRYKGQIGGYIVNCGKHDEKQALCALVYWKH